MIDRVEGMGIINCITAKVQLQPIMQGLLQITEEIITQAITRATRSTISMAETIVKRAKSTELITPQSHLPKVEK